jgi:nitrate reductase alpha subunit
MLDWTKGECEAIPGKTMPDFKVVERDYENLYQQFISYGPNVRAGGLGAHGTHYAVDDVYDELIEHGRCRAGVTSATRR